MNKRQFNKALGLDHDNRGFNLGYLYNRDDLVNYYLEKYFNLFMSSYEIKSSATTPFSRYYLLKKLWYAGTIAIYRIPHTDLLGFAPYAINEYDMYGFPATITLINERGASPNLVPTGQLAVNRDVVIGWYQRNHKNLVHVVKSYAEQLADIQLTINTNLFLHKMPWLVITDDDDTAKRIKSTITAALNNELAVALNTADKNSLTSLNTATPYIIDKLYQYKVDIENELKTYMGLDNQGNYEKRERMLVDEVNSQRATIDDSCDNFTDSFNDITEQVHEVLGLDIKFEARMRQHPKEDDHHDETAA